MSRCAKLIFTEMLIYFFLYDAAKLTWSSYSLCRFVLIGITRSHSPSDDFVLNHLSIFWHLLVLYAPCIFVYNHITQFRVVLTPISSGFCSLCKAQQFISIWFLQISRNQICQTFFIINIFLKFKDC